MKNYLVCSAMIWLGLALTSCNKELFQLASSNSAAGTFHYIWNDFAENYGLFGVRQIDWDSAYDAHYPQIDETTTASQLHAHVVELLQTLNDRHVTLYPASNPELPVWSVDLTPDGTYVMEDFNWTVVKDNYISQYREPAPAVQYGVLEGNIGYIHISNFDGTRLDYEKGLDAALNELADLPGLVIDIRDNSGGYDPNAQYVAGRFARQAALYMTSRKKNGPGPDDFAETREWYVRPVGARQFTRPTIVLTGDATASAAETFLLALLTQPHITQMGGTTSGSFSDNPMWEAPNGWAYTISIGDFRAADGKSYEGIGLAPQVPQTGTAEDWQNGRDVVLEKALERLH